MDVTADELRIESLFPADEATERFFRMVATSDERMTTEPMKDGYFSKSVK
jgi:hypothetical protein